MSIINVVPLIENSPLDEMILFLRKMKKMFRILLKNSLMNIQIMSQIEMRFIILLVK